jgi:hypothetical protein
MNPLVCVCVWGVNVCMCVRAYIYIVNERDIYKYGQHMRYKNCVIEIFSLQR